MTIGQQIGSRATIVAETSWRDAASCRFSNRDLFFPDGDRDIATAEAETQAAKAVCRTCQVRDACLEFALVTNQEAGIWGGSTEYERRGLRRAWLADRRRKAC